MCPSEATVIMFGTFSVLIVLRIPVSFALGLACVPIMLLNDRRMPILLISMITMSVLVGLLDHRRGAGACTSFTPSVDRVLTETEQWLASRCDFSLDAEYDPTSRWEDDVVDGDRTAEGDVNGNDVRCGLMR